MKKLDTTMNIYETKNAELVTKLNKPVHDIHVELYPEYFQPYDFNGMREVFAKLMEDEKNRFLILEIDEEAIGYVWYTIKVYSDNPLKKGYTSLFVHQISIEPSHQRKGYGQEVMTYLYEVAKENNIRIVELDYWVNNSRAKGFYEKEGFIPYREHMHKKLK